MSEAEENERSQGVSVTTKWFSISFPGKGLVILSLVASASFIAVTWQIVETLRVGRIQHEKINDHLFAVLEHLSECGVTAPRPRQSPTPER